jgi:thioredoxin reductase
MFEPGLEFMQAIIICYGRQKTRLHYNKEFEGLGVNYCKGSHITSCLDYVIVTCVMNQS